MVVALGLGWWLEHRQVAHMRWRFKAVRAWIGLLDIEDQVRGTGMAYPLELFEDVPASAIDSGLPISKTPSPYPIR